MAEAVYILCAVTAAACSALLFRGYARSRARLLFWSGLCFLGLALQSVVLFLDMAVLTDLDLELLRSGIALASLLLLAFGLVWETR